MLSIPILTNDSFRVLNVISKNPVITPKEIALKTSISVNHVLQHMEGLRQGKLLKEKQNSVKSKL